MSEWLEWIRVPVIIGGAVWFSLLLLRILEAKAKVRRELRDLRRELEEVKSDLESIK